MGIFDGLKGLFSSSRPSGPKVMVLKDLAFARTIPLRVKQAGHRRGAVTTCECGAPFEEVLLTTRGTGADPDAWRLWPLVIDGWRCTRCDRTLVPRFLEPEEAAAVGKASVEAATAGREEEAEAGFRRLMASWPGYRPALVDLSSVLLARAERLDLGGKPSLSLLDEIEGLLREALELEPPPGQAQVVQRLAATLLLREQSALAEDLVAAELARPTLSPTDRQELEQVAQWVRLRGDLYDRGSELARPAFHLHGQPAPTLDAQARALAERGVTELLRHHERAPERWQSLWLAAMATKTLHGATAAAQLFGRAFAIVPGEGSVGREYALALLGAGDTARAVEVSRVTVAANPMAADLVCNLALAELLSGAVPAALAAAERAVALDPKDPINHNVLRLVRAVQSGARAAPRSLAELEQR